ncbi:very long chain fatty acid elongase 6-like [Planococcus citri]|uniref:very long chain fatty acid elongase 6-like n=1 Tax=Planococcus citri TaxID=170843 RepID=UPI0031F9AFCD
MATLDTTKFSSSPPIYWYTFAFEENYSPERGRRWMNENYWNAYLLCGIYVFLIFSIQFYMRNKPRYDLRRPLALWSAALSVFSIVGAMRSVPELYHMLTNYSLYDTVCYPIVGNQAKTTEFWTWLFILSKLPELGDTMFIVLRKQPLLFLHWYHHVTVLLYTWSAFAENSSYVRWFVSMNYSVHAFMYSYYTLRALRFSVPKFVMISITFSQILQMVMGCIVVILAVYYRLTEQPCQVSNKDIFFCWCMYFSYLILFSRLFYKLYLSPSKTKPSSIPDNTKIKGK